MLSIVYALLAVWASGTPGPSFVVSDTAANSIVVEPRPVIIPQIDARGVKILNTANDRLGRAQAIIAKVVTIRYSFSQRPGQAPDNTTPQVKVQIISLLKPGYVQFKEFSRKGPGDSLTTIRLCTPKGRWEYESYMRDTALYFTDSEARWFVPSIVRGALDSPELVPEVGEWNRNWLKHPLFQSIRYVGRSVWNGAMYDVVEWVYSRSAELPETQDVYTSQAYVGVNDTVIRRVVTLQSTNGEPIQKFEATLDAIQINPSLTGADFVNPFKESRPYRWTPPNPSDFLNKPWLALDKPGHLLDGTKINNIHDLVRGKRAVVLWAWATTCSGCVEEFPLMDQMRREYKPKGVEIVGVDPGGDAELVAAKRYLSYNLSEMPIIFDAEEWSESIYRKSLISAIIDANGTVVFAGGKHIADIRAQLDKIIGDKTP